MSVTLTPPPPRGGNVLDGQQKFVQPWAGWFRNLFNLLSPGKTEDVVVGGVTLHFVNGVYSGHD